MSAHANLGMPESPRERRHLNRVGVRLPGKYMGQDRKDRSCTTINVSTDGIALAAEETRGLGERIVAYIHPLGRVRGVVSRHFSGGFAMSMDLPPLKRDRLGALVDWLASRDRSQTPDYRPYARLRTRHPHTTLTLPSGRELSARIIDFSRADAALTLTDAPAAQAPEIGTTVTIGSKRAVVVRSSANGVAIEFTRLLPVQEFGENFEP